jgi:hypothetical protein
MSPNVRQLVQVLCAIALVILAILVLVTWLVMLVSAGPADLYRNSVTTFDAVTYFFNILFHSGPYLIASLVGAVIFAKIWSTLHPLPPVPHTYTNAPKITWPPAVSGPVVDATPPAIEAPLAAPTFAQLLDQGIIGHGRPLILGYPGKEPITGTWRDLFSFAIGGMQGSGKTTTERSIAGQAALNGARFLVCDPHAEIADESLAKTLEPLNALYLAPPASEPRAILRTLQRAEREMRARLANAPRNYPLIVCIDEYTALMRADDETSAAIARCVEAIAQEGRKVLVYAMIAGQIWTADRTGGSAVRDALTAVVAHRMKRNQARSLLLPEEARECERLPTGHALLLRANGTDVQRVAMPLTTHADLVRVAAMLTATTIATNAAMRQTATAPATDTAMDDLPPLRMAPDARSERVRELLSARTPITRIIEDVWGHRNGDGYRKASQELSEIMARLVGGDNA